MSKKTEQSKEILSHFLCVGNVVPESRGNCCISFVPTCDKDVLYDERGRVYAFVAKRRGVTEILKIGISSGKRGMHSTISFYMNAPSHDPGMNRYSMHYVMRDLLNMGYKISVYVRFGKDVKTIREGFKGEKYIVVEAPNPKADEAYWLEKHLSIIGEYPRCNYQERGNRDLPYMKEYGAYISKRRKRSKRRK